MPGDLLKCKLPVINGHPVLSVPDDWNCYLREILDTLCSTDCQPAVRMMLDWKTQKKAARIIRGLRLLLLFVCLFLFQWSIQKAGCSLFKAKKLNSRFNQSPEVPMGVDISDATVPLNLEEKS